MTSSIKQKFGFILCFVLTIVLNAQTDKRLNGVEKELNQILKVTNAPGFAVAVVKGDKVVYAKGFGYRDVENKIPVDANTLFAIGSSSKAFTSAILGQLRHEDKLSFDDSPIDHIPELRFFNDDLNNTINIKDLMSHRTGIPRHDASWYLFPTFDRDSLMRRIEFQKPFTGIREQWYYNNFMFLTQGVIAERITGKSWEDNIRERFFKPLGMNRSNVSIDELEKSKNAAFGYELKKDKSLHKMDYYRIAAMAPAGSINSSVNEMSNWLITWINKGKFKETEIIPEAYIDEAIGSHMVVSGALPDKDIPDAHIANYGYAWFISSYKGHYRVEHGGNIDGFAANVAFYPSDNIGIVVLANQNGSAIPSLARNAIADRMLGTNKTNWAKRFSDAMEDADKAEKEAKVDDDSGKVANTKPSHIQQDYTGSYSNLGYGDFDIELKNDSLFANFKLMKLYLKHYHYDVFEPFEVTDKGVDTTGNLPIPIRFNFKTNSSGDIADVGLKIEPALENDITFKRTPNNIDLSEKTLASYIGTYELSGLEIKIYTKGSTLYGFVAGQPEYELIATAKHKFSLKTLEGYKIEFNKEKDGAINSLNMIQPNGTFKATRKKE